MAKWVCINRDSAHVGAVSAETADEAVIACAAMWAEGPDPCYDIDHVHAVGQKSEDCQHCKAIWEKQRALPKH